MKYVVSLDSSSSACKAYLIDLGGVIKKEVSIDLNSYRDQDGWCEHEALEIWENQFSALKQVIEGIPKEEILGISITNQRETVVAWDKDTLTPVYRAISWQDNRGKKILHNYSQHEDYIRKTTGLYVNEYFSATKIRWILDNIKYPIEKLRVGTVDTWLIAKLTEGKEFLTDITNASRTLLFDINTETWNKKLLQIFDIPEHILPEVRPSGSFFGEWENIPILAVIGDQQASLLSCGFNSGTVECTYGTGLFLLANLGEEKKFVDGTVTTIAWKIEGTPTHYALECGSFVGGNLLRQLHKEGYFFNYELKDEETEESLYLKTQDKRLFIFDKSPYKDLIWNIDETKDRGEKILKSVLNALALSVYDLIQLFSNCLKIKKLCVNGGISKIKYLGQLQSNLLKIDVLKCNYENHSALGAAFLALLSSKIIEVSDIDLLKSKSSAVYNPLFCDLRCDKLLEKWKEYKSSL